LTHDVIVTDGMVSAAAYHLPSRGVRVLGPEGTFEEDLICDPS
jgi:hypothetical protein